MVPKLFLFSKFFGFCIFTACLVDWKMPVYCIKKKKICFFFGEYQIYFISLRTRESFDVFNSLDEIYLVFTSKKQISSIYYSGRDFVTNGNKTHHNINIPRTALVGELICGGCLCLYLLCRGLSISVATSPVRPPTRCTGPAPAMSTTPIE